MAPPSVPSKRPSRRYVQRDRPAPRWRHFLGFNSQRACEKPAPERVGGERLRAGRGTRGRVGSGACEWTLACVVLRLTRGVSGAPSRVGRLPPRGRTHHHRQSCIRHFAATETDPFRVPRVLHAGAVRPRGDQQRAKAELKDPKINGAQEVAIGDGRTAIVIQVPFRLLKAFHKIQQRLVRELEKKFSGKDAWWWPTAASCPCSKAVARARPRSRTLTAVHANLLEDPVPHGDRRKAPALQAGRQPPAQGVPRRGDRNTTEYKLDPRGRVQENDRQGRLLRVPRHRGC